MTDAGRPNQDRDEKDWGESLNKTKDGVGPLIFLFQEVIKDHTNQ
jgi:hypothetical protein